MKTSLIFLLLAAVGGCAAFSEKTPPWVASEEPGFSALMLTNAYGHQFRLLARPEHRPRAERHRDLLIEISSELARELGLENRFVRWADVVFTPASSFKPVERSDIPKWPLSAEVLESDDPRRLRNHLLEFIAHEQVHRAQEIVHGLQSRGPRWFSEGMADWVSLQVVERFDPQLAERERARRVRDRATVEGSVRLGSWGGFRPKREAIMRQVTPEQLERMLADENYAPQGVFSFGPGDFETDEFSEVARYGAALELFDSLAVSCGEDGLMRALRELRLEEITNDTLADFFEKRCNLDIRPYLK